MAFRRFYRFLGGLLLAAMLVTAPGAGADNNGYYPFGKSAVVVGEIDKLRRQIARCWKCRR